MCDGYTREEGDFSSELNLGPTITCEKCGSDMILKQGPFGPYMSCTNAECKNTRKILKNGEVAPPKEDAVELPELPCEKNPSTYYVLRDGASGIFLAAKGFPKIRESRPVKVSELKRFIDRISPKFHYLANGPEHDPEGNLAEVRFSRKLKVQYLSSVNEEGKQTNWAAYYHPETNSWQESTLRSKTAAAKDESEDKPKTRKRTTKA